ncbi:hypothetical protein ACG7TL_007950 [Trametes sanguinea]
MTTTTGASASAIEPVYIELIGPQAEYTALELAAADAIRFGSKWEPGSPPGVYIDDDGRPYPYGLFGGNAHAVDSDGATDATESVLNSPFSSLSVASTHTFITRDDSTKPDSTSSDAPGGIHVHQHQEAGYAYAAHDLYIHMDLQRTQRVVDTLGKSNLFVNMPLKPRAWTVSAAYGWSGTPTRSKWSPIELKSCDCIAVAVAGSRSVVMNDAYDGTVGLGISRYPLGFHQATSLLPPEGPSPPARVDIPSFIDTLVAQGKLPAAPLDDATQQRPKLIMYFVIRAYNQGKSYLALQDWPFEGPNHPQWSPKINVVPGHRSQWTLALQEIKMWLDLDEEEKKRPFQTADSKSATISIDLSAWPFYLDTGTASSYFPRVILNEIIDKVGLCRVDKGEDVSLSTGFYRRPPGYNRDESAIMQWTFWSDGAPVSIKTDLRQFLADRRGDGIVWPRELGSIVSSNRLPGILGLNFFHCIYAAFYLPEDPSDSPYVRLSPATGSSDVVKVPDFSPADLRA